jgi:hypothetical protein
MIMRVKQNDDRIKDRPEPLPRPRGPVRDEKSLQMSAAVEAIETQPPLPPPAPPVANQTEDVERLKQYRIDHDKLHVELAERAGDVEEERARAHAEMMQAIHELMQMLGTMLAAQGHAVVSDGDTSKIYDARTVEFQIRRGQNGLIDRVIATPKLDG